MSKTQIIYSNKRNAHSSQCSICWGVEGLTPWCLSAPQVNIDPPLINQSKKSQKYIADPPSGFTTNRLRTWFEHSKNYIRRYDAFSSSSEPVARHRLHRRFGICCVPISSSENVSPSIERAKKLTGLVRWTRWQMAGSSPLMRSNLNSNLAVEMFNRTKYAIRLGSISLGSQWEKKSSLRISMRISMRSCPRSWFLNEVLDEVLDSQWGFWWGSWFSMRFLPKRPIRPHSDLDFGTSQ